MRTATEIAEVQRQARIVFSAKGNEYALEKSQGVQDESMTQFYEPYLAIEYLSSATLSLFQLNAICDYLIELGYYFSADYAIFNEAVYDSTDYTAS